MKSTVPQILLTGSSGFLGQHLLHSLIHQPSLHDVDDGSDSSSSRDNSCQIHALYGSMEGFPETVQKYVDELKTSVSVHVHKLDFTNSKEVESWILTHASKMDVCVHMAAMSSPRTCQEDPRLARALNVPETFFHGLIQQHNVPIIALSTDQVYEGTNPPYTESDPLRPVNIYGTTKVEMEECLRKLSNQYSVVPIILLRSSIILGPKAPLLRDKAHTTFLHFCQSRKGQHTEFYTDECRSVIAVDNVVRVIRWFLSRLLKRQPTNDAIIISGTYNMGGPEKVSRMQMAQAVFRHLGFSEDCLIASQKANLPSGAVPSPLDITMDSHKLYNLVKDDVKWEGLREMVEWTFPN